MKDHSVHIPDHVESVSGAVANWMQPLWLRARHTYKGYESTVGAHAR
jgi:hypothetical protein